MIYKSGLLTQASGSLNGLTFSHNKGGQYVRARVIPTNPGSSFQSTVRQAMAQLSDLWSSVLTSAQRSVWDFYATQVSVINALGDPIFISGFNHYLRSNIPRLQTDLPRVDNGPTTYTLGTFTEPAVSIDTANDEVDVTFENTDAWANEDDSAMLVYASRPLSPTINFFKGPYRYADGIDGDSVTPPTSPAALALPFAVAAGNRVYFKISVSRADGRLSTPFRDSADAA